MIRSNEGRPLTANRWKNGLMFHKGGLAFYRAHEHYCDRIIDIVFPVPRDSDDLEEGELE